MTEAVMALDIGGTKLAAGLVERDGTVRSAVTCPTPATRDPEEVFGAVLDLLAPFEAPVIGIGSAGPLDPFRGTVSPLNIPAWREFPLTDRLRAARGAEVVLAGDGHCFALGEYWLGAGRGSSALLGIVVSTGVGGGLILDGGVVLGPSGNAGHIGHAIVSADGVECACGSLDCVEAYASGPSMVRWASSQGWSGRSGRELATSAREGHPVALAAFDRGARALAAGILSAAAIVDLDRIVIGGGIAAAGPLLFDPLQSWLAKLTGLGFLQGLEVLPAALPDAGVIGAAALAYQGSAQLNS